MNFREILIISAGMLTLPIAIFHVPTFWQLMFRDWKREIKKTGVLNRQLANTLLIALTISLFIFGIISISYAKEMSQVVGMGWGITLSLALFWLWRLVWQVIYFRRSKNEFELKLKIFHYLLIIVFTILFIAYILPFV